MSSELTDNQVRGYKATLHNPRVSDEAKENAQQVLEGGASKAREDREEQGQEQGLSTRVLAGYKATLKVRPCLECGIPLVPMLILLQNPNVGDEAKERAERILQENDAM